MYWILFTKQEAMYPINPVESINSTSYKFRNDCPWRCHFIFLLSSPVIAVIHLLYGKRRHQGPVGYFWCRY